MVRKNEHFKIIKEGNHVGELHSGMGKSLLEMEEHFGDSIGKILSNIVRSKHGDGEIILDTDRGKFKLPEDKASDEEMICVIKGMVNGPKEEEVIIEEEIIPTNKFGGMEYIMKPKLKKKIGSLEEKMSLKKPIQTLKVT